MYQIFDFTITDTTLSRLIERFVPPSDLYYFDDDQILRTLLEEGIAVYTRSEFSKSFPTFSLEYGSLYHVWNLTIPKQSFVTLLQATQLITLSPAIRETLLAYQIKCGRGHIFDENWFNEFEQPQGNTVTVDGSRFYLLTSQDWEKYSTEVRKKWVLKWLREWHKDDEGKTILEFDTNHEMVPHNLIKEYAGTFADKSGPNCFAAAIAMAVGGACIKNHEQSRVLISQWLHPEPFFRLLKAQRYSKFAELRMMNDLLLVQPADVLVWYTGDHAAGHAAFAVTNKLVFQKHGQGWESPWQVLKIDDVWYNEYLKTGGHINIYRK